MQKIKLAVIFGGKSVEHEVSCTSATSILKNLNLQKYDVLKIGITKEGKWQLFNGDVEDIARLTWYQAESNNSMGSIINSLSKCDVVFPVLHGLFGEDGSIQGLFEILDIPYVGCGTLASALCMDKAMSKIIFAHAGLPQVSYFLINEIDITEKKQEICNNVSKKIGYPCFVKPANSGSSVGISKAHNITELLEYIEIANKYDSKILIEKAIDMQEIECAVLGSTTPIVSVVGEITTTHEFYDYSAKYTDGISQMIIPASINKQAVLNVQDIAIKAFKAMGCYGMARVDFFLQKRTNRLYINEINTIPGFTNLSMYPKLFEASGINYPDLLDILINLAIERKKI